MRLFMVCCLLSFLVSCSETKKELLPPKLSADSVIDRDQMILILADVHLIEATLTLQRNRRENTSLLTQSYYQWLCRKYSMSLLRFRENLNYYKSDPQDFSKMYKEVAKNLTDQWTLANQPVRVKVIHK